jgi:cation:H+ antiporter
MVFTSFLALAAGIALLLGGAHFLTNYASSLAKRWAISEYAIGLTFVAFFTSLPEISVALVSGLTSFLDPSTIAVDIASGTVIGSNITNLALILGLAALIHPLGGASEYMKEEYFLFVLTVLFSAALFMGMGPGGGIAIFAIISLYLLYLVRKRPKGPLTAAERMYYRFFTRESFLELFLAIAGAVGLLAGAMLTVNFVMSISESMGISNFVIASVAVALGTSLPEAMASVMAAAKKMKGISLGNLIGSNIFNIAGLAAASVFTHIPTNPKMLLIDIPIMLIAALFVLAVSGTGRKLSTKAGLSLLLLYALFILLQMV